MMGWVESRQPSASGPRPVRELVNLHGSSLSCHREVVNLNINQLVGPGDLVVVGAALVRGDVHKVDSPDIECLLGGVEAVVGAAVVVLVLCQDVYGEMGDE